MIEISVIFKTVLSSTNRRLFEHICVCILNARSIRSFFYAGCKFNNSDFIIYFFVFVSFYLALKVSDYILSAKRPYFEKFH